MFSQQSIFSLVDILFKDMYEDFQLIEPQKLDSDQEDDQDDSKGKQESEQAETEDDPTKYGIDIDEYMGRKGILTIERIKDIVGEIMSSCQKKLNYEIIEYIMRGVVYDKKKLRESFLQEILNAQGNAANQNAIEAYIN